MNRDEYKASYGARLTELGAEIDTIMINLGASFADTGIDNYAYTDHPASTDYIHFQLRTPMTDYSAAVGYLEHQLKKARELAADTLASDVLLKARELEQLAEDEAAGRVPMPELRNHRIQASER